MNYAVAILGFSGMGKVMRLEQLLFFSISGCFPLTLEFPESLDVAIVSY